MSVILPYRAISQPPVPDPCLPLNMEETIALGQKTLTLRGTGSFDVCRTALRPVLKGNASLECTDKTCKVAHSFKKPPVKYTNLEFFGTSEFFYTMRDTLRIAGEYSVNKFNTRAKVHSHVCVCVCVSVCLCVCVCVYIIRYIPIISGVLSDRMECARDKIQ